jgi:coenzyme F420-reducing hydrogenase alpha subunit
MRGQQYTDAQTLTSRICGICAVAHSCASLRASEDALGVELTPQTLLLRKLILYGEQIQSHWLHTLFLVLPDALGAPSVLPLAASHPDEIKIALRLKKLGNYIGEVVGGRHVHPIALCVGGSTAVPTEKQLRELREMLVELRSDVEAVVNIFATVQWPNLVRETEYLCIRDPEEYAFYAGDLVSSDGGTVTPRDYKEMIHEKIVPHSTAKHAYCERDEYQVGALARFNNNHEQLHPEAKKAAEKLGLSAPSHNPFHINLAQVVEAVHCHERCIEIIDELLEAGVKYEAPEVEVKAGRGVGMVEAPRGLLLHDYTYDENGIATGANCIIPTAQNYGSIEADMRAFVPQILDRPKEEITLLLEMLVRAYDPCISCSVHMLDVKFV